MSKQFTIGSRGSLLALTQTGWAKRQLEKLNPGISFKIQIITTQGDQIQNIPLSELNGKDFFTKELDSQLINGSVDLVVHSGKDLGSDRPDEICIGAIPKRELPHDVLLLRKDVADQLRDKKFIEKTMYVGTSSPRRIFQLSSLKNILPFHQNLESLEIKDKFLRGNVDTRVGKLLAGQYHGIILAASGLERLSLSDDGMRKLEEYAKSLEIIFLPLETSTPAPAQGALAIECRSSDSDMKDILSKLDHPQTRENIKIEKKLFKTFGGTCHLPLGIFHTNNHTRLFGQSGNGEPVDEVQSPHQEIPKNLETCFIGLKNEFDNSNILEDKLIDKIAIEKNFPNSHLFIASSHCIPNLNQHYEKDANFSLMASGLKTRIEMAKQGYLVNASAYSHGESSLIDIQNSKLFELFFHKAKTSVLTHADTQSKLGEVIPSYKRVINMTIDSHWEKKILECKAFFWTSYPQYQTYLQRFPELIKSDEVKHFCGLGKTSDKFKINKIKHIPLTSYKDLLKAVK